MSKCANQLTQAADDMAGRIPASRRFRFQFNLRTMLIAVSLIAAITAVPSYWWRQISRDQKLADHLRSKGGTVRFADTETTNLPSNFGNRPPRWFCAIVGSPDFWSEKVVVLPNFTSPFSKNDLPSVWQLCNVKTLVINLDDVEPIDLRGMRNLEDLSTVCLYRCRLDKTTIQIIAALPHLKTLYLETCDITGDAWSAFDQLSDLTELHLNGNSVTDERLAAIGRCDRLNSLSLLGTKVTASGLRALERFASLQEVVVSPTTNSSSATHGVSEQELQELDPGRIKFKRIVSVQIDD